MTATITTLRLITAEWRFLLYGFLMSLWSSLGQTFFISLFSAEIRADLSLSHGAFGSYYALATMASAFTLFWLGRLADSVSVPRLSAMTLGGLCLAALHFSTVSSVLFLIAGIYFLRLSGQGMMYHVYSTAVARRYAAARGRALAICGFGMNAAEAVFPVIIVILLGLFDWRLVWAVMPLVMFVSFAPFIPALTRRTDLQDGPGRKTDSDDGRPGDHATSLRRRQLVRDSAFWAVIIWLMMIPSFTITGLFFHQIHIAEQKAVPIWLWSSYYIWYALAAVMGAMASGFLVDRMGAHKSVSITQIPMIFAGICLIYAQGPVMLAGFFCLFGLAGGMVQPAVNALLAERYGTRWLGEIKALASPLNVFSSALSPAIMGVLFDSGSSLALVLWLLTALSAVSFVMPLIWFNILGLTRPG